MINWVAKGMNLIAVSVCLAAVSFGFSRPAFTATIIVDPAHKQLQTALSEALDGDVLRLLPGRHAGPLVISKRVELHGEPGAIIAGDGSGSVITIKASGVIVRDLTVTGSGLLLETQDSGIFISKEASGVKILGNKVENNLIGVYVWGGRDALVRGNEIIGRSDLRLNERGNGVQIWNAPGAVIEDNQISFGRDGIFVTTSKKNIFKNNLFQNLRFAVHYMYTNQSSVIGNRSVGNHIGYAIMFAKRIKVIGNVSEGDRDRGILFNYANRVVVEGNVVKSGLDGVGPEKCLFIYNSNKNRIEGNRFANCEYGVHFTAGSERNKIFGNAFVGNRTQVKYVGTRWLDWSHKGRGNYWSDSSAFDLNRDGIADTAYRPNDITDQIIWRYPIAKLLITSPAVKLLKWSQSAFPALHPGGVIDTAPLMEMPDFAKIAREPKS